MSMTEIALGKALADVLYTAICNGLRLQNRANEQRANGYYDRANAMYEGVNMIANITYTVLGGEFPYQHIKAFELLAETDNGLESKDYIAMFRKALDQAHSSNRRKSEQ